MRPAVALIAAFFALVPTAEAVGERVWIDTDAACNGATTVDVDDCWALALMVHDPDIEIVGLSTVFGNRDRAPSREEATAILGHAGAQSGIAPIPGANAPLSDGASGSEAAAQAMAAELAEGPMTILALGPLTNLAAMLAIRPDLAQRIDRIVAVAGQVPGERFFPGDSPLLHVHDMNFRKDVEAFEHVLRSGVPLTLVPYRAGSQAPIGRALLDRISSAEPERARWLANISRDWLRFWEHGFAASGFFPFDLVAAGLLTHADRFSCRATVARVIRRRALFATRDTLEVTGEVTGEAVGGGVSIQYCDEVDPALACRLVGSAAGVAACGHARRPAVRETPRAASPRPG